MAHDFLKDKCLHMGMSLLNSKQNLCPLGNQEILIPCFDFIEF